QLRLEVEGGECLQGLGGQPCGRTNRRRQVDVEVLEASAPPRRLVRQPEAPAEREIAVALHGHLPGAPSGAGAEGPRAGRAAAGAGAAAGVGGLGWMRPPILSSGKVSLLKLTWTLPPSLAWRSTLASESSLWCVSTWKFALYFLL